MRVYGKELPAYLLKDIEAFEKGRREGSSLMDCLWCELYGSINSAEIDDRVLTQEEAQQLRDKYLWGKAT